MNDDDTQDRYCPRCGQPKPDDDDQRLTEAVTKTREAIAQQCAAQARARFQAVGEIRRMRGLSHPRLRKVYGKELQPGWLIQTYYPKYDSSHVGQRMWDVVVEAENDCGYVHVIGLDPIDGRSSYGAGYGGGTETYWIDDFSIEVMPREREGS